MTNPAARGSATTVATPPDHFPLTRRDFAFILAFWGIYALLGIANRIVDPRGVGPELSLSSPPVVLAIVEPLMWAIITPLLFALAGRLGSGRIPRAAQFALLVALGVIIALGVSLTNDALRTALFPRPAPGASARPHGPPLWFGFINSLIIYAGVIAAGLARAYSLRYRARREQATHLEAQLAEARLDALRRQLDPHFLFNTLHAVSSLVERDPRGVRRMISRLSELLRFSIEGERSAEVPLRRELELLDRYLEIMQVRFQGRLEVTRRIDEQTLDTPVPTMILQPLVENAIRHGVEQVAGTGRIAIESTRSGESVMLCVRDSGPGIAPATIADAAGRVGLRNTIARLEQLYGPGERFTLNNDPAGGTVATVRVPYRNDRELRVQGVSSDGDVAHAR